MPDSMVLSPPNAGSRGAIEGDAVAALPTFDALPLSPDLRQALDVMGYKHPTPVQLAVFEPAVRGRSVVVQARTGTGKTSAFGLPIIDQLIRRSVAKVQALVLCPTRELALQVSRELEQLAQFRGTKIVAIYGGAPMGKQIEALEAGAQLVVGTPGRVLDHLRRKTLDPSNVRIFVLDEADEMLSMGFAKELHAIVETLPKERQGLFFSATIPPDIERLATSQLKDPEFVTLSSDQVGALEIDHFVYIMRGGDKRSAFIRILEVENPESAIIFCNTKEETERLTEALQNKGFDADWLNGDLAQNDRERVMARTREGKLRFLVCTDVAARGIDISHLTHVINFDFPETAEYYVHRTGRTGRAGKTGTAISIIGPKDIGGLYLLRLTYKIRPIEKQLPTEGEIKTRAELDVVELFEDAFGSKTPHPDDLAIARRLMTHYDAERIVAGLIRDHLGARPGDPVAEAAEARRAKNPPPVPAEPPAWAPPQAPAAPRTSGGGRGQETRLPPRESQSAPEAPAQRREAPREPGRDARATARVSMSTGEPRPSRDGRAPVGDGAPRRGMPHASFRTWEPPEEQDDDKPIFTVSDAPVPTSAGSSPAVAPAPRRPREAPRQPREPRAEAPVERTSTTAVAPLSAAGLSPEDDPAFAQIFINVGRRDGARGEDIQKLLEVASALPPDAGHCIRIRDRMTFVSVKREVVEAALAAFAGQVIGGRTVVAEIARARKS